MKKYWFVFCKTDVMLEKVGDNYTIPLSDEAPIPLHPWTHVLNVTPMENGTEVRAFMVEQPVTGNPQYEMCGLRPSFYLLSTEFYLKAGKCHELLYWDGNTKFCGVCGAPMKMHTDISKRCTNCGKRCGRSWQRPSLSSYTVAMKSCWFMPAISSPTSMAL